jgi:antitoxin component YwqK of YwqJK toxin-antitoxin module
MEFSNKHVEIIQDLVKLDCPKFWTVKYFLIGDTVVNNVHGYSIDLATFYKKEDAENFILRTAEKTQHNKFYIVESGKWIAITSSGIGTLHMGKLDKNGVKLFEEEYKRGFVEKDEVDNEEKENTQKNIHEEQKYFEYKNCWVQLFKSYNGTREYFFELKLKDSKINLYEKEYPHFIEKIIDDIKSLNLSIENEVILKALINVTKENYMNEKYKTSYYDKEKKKIKERTTFVNGKKIKEEYWYENGQLKYEWPIRDGVQHGIQTGYSEDGSLKYESYYENGEPST